ARSPACALHSFCGWQSPGAVSVFHADALAVDAAGRHPAVDAAPVVADLEATALDGLHQVQVLPPVDLAQDDVPDPQGSRVNRLDRAQLARGDLAPHGLAPGTDLDGLAAL